jgi:hypothetical protein
MAQTSRLGISYNFAGDSLTANSNAFRNAVKEVMVYNFTQTFNESDNPLANIENVASDLAELIEEYVTTAKITIPTASIPVETSVTTTVATAVTTVGTALAQAGAGTGAGVGTGEGLNTTPTILGENSPLGGGLS